MIMKNDAKFEFELTFQFKNGMGNLTDFELKKHRETFFQDTGELCKIWRKSDLWFGRWHEEFDKYSLEHSKLSKLGLSWDPFIQKRKCTSLKITRVLCVMKMKNDAKFERELTCQFKIDMRNSTNFDPNTQKSQKCDFNGLLFTKVYNVLAKKLQRSYV